MGRPRAKRRVRAIVVGVGERRVVARSCQLKGLSMGAMMKYGW